jgi:hypothetical protein
MDAMNEGAAVPAAANEVERLQALLEAPRDDKEDKDKGGDAATAPALERTPPDEGAGDGPDEVRVTGNEDEGDSDPAEPAIAAPKSWPADMRDAFVKLPRDLQEVIAARESERDAAFNRQVNEAAEKRKAAEAELTAASSERRQYLANLSALIDGLVQQSAGEFADIRTTGDLERMAAQDPQRYLRWQARRETLQAARGEQARLLEREQAEQAKRVRGFALQQRRLLLEKIPELADRKTAKATQAEMNDYLRGIGFTDQETEQWLDHRYALVIRDAVRYRKGQQAAKSAVEKKVVNLPRVQKPGSGNDAKGEKSAQQKAAVTRIARFGTTDQQAAALDAILRG